MPVFRYEAHDRTREEHQERGTVVAATEAEAKSKLQRMDLRVTRLRRVTGLQGLWLQMKADVR
jgi:type II secretory pathway component PulF